MSDLGGRRTSAKRKRTDIRKVKTPSVAPDSPIGLASIDALPLAHSTRLYNLGCLLQDVLHFVSYKEMPNVLMRLHATGDKRMHTALVFHVKTLRVTTCDWSCGMKCPCNCLHLPFATSPGLHSIAISIRERPANTAWTNSRMKKFRVSALQTLPSNLRVLYMHSQAWVDGWRMEYSLMAKHMTCLASLVYLKLQLSHRMSDCLDFSKCVNLKTLVLHCKERYDQRFGVNPVRWKLPNTLEAFSGMTHPNDGNVHYLPSSLTALRCTEWAVTNDICAIHLPLLTHLSARRLFLGDVVPKRLPATLNVLYSESSVRLSQPVQRDVWPPNLSDVRLVCLNGSADYASDTTRKDDPARGLRSAFPPSTTALRAVSGPHIYKLEDWKTFVAEPCFTRLVVLSLDVAVSMKPSTSTFDTWCKLTFADLHQSLSRCVVLEDLTTRIKVNDMVTPLVPLICTSTVRKCRIMLDVVGHFRHTNNQRGLTLSFSRGDGFDDFSCLTHLSIEQSATFTSTSLFGDIGVGDTGQCVWTGDGSDVSGVKLSPHLVVSVVRACRPPVSPHDNVYICMFAPDYVDVVHFNGRTFSRFSGDNETIAFHTWYDDVTHTRRTMQLNNCVIGETTQRNPFAPPMIM